MRSKSARLVTISGTPPMGPRRVGPTKAVVLVPTPSIDLARKLVSSTYTPGAKYSGTAVAPLCVLAHGDGTSRATVSCSPAPSLRATLLVAANESSASGSGGLVPAG